jgi:ABC-type transporter Mla MlaB component
MTETFSWSFGAGRLHLAGRIDENADLAALVSQVPADGVRIDLSELVRINSIGVREWMDFLAALRDRPVVLERCAPVFVDQLNAIANFAGTAKVESVMAAFECENDGDVRLIEARIADLQAGSLPRAPRCERCQAETAPTQEDDLYYRFLRYLGQGK